MKKIVLLFSFLAIIGCGSSTPDVSTAKEAARAAILNKLTSPSSAKFHHNEVVKKIDDSTFNYTETIESTNSFGGMIAQNAIVKVKWISGDASEVTNWSVLDIQFAER